MESCFVALKCVAGSHFAMLRRWVGVGGEGSCGVVVEVFAKRPSAIYHESSRTHPKLEWKCDVSVGLCSCVCWYVVGVACAVCRVVRCGAVRCGVVLCWIVCCCVVGCRRCVVGFVSFIVNALAVVWCTKTTCHIYDRSKRTTSVIVHMFHRKVFYVHYGFNQRKNHPCKNNVQTKRLWIKLIRKNCTT